MTQKPKSSAVDHSAAQYNGLASSIGLHALIVFLGVFAWPQIAREPLNISPPIEVTFVNPSEITESPAPQKQEEEVKPPPPETMTAEAPPDLTPKPPEPEIVEEEPPKPEDVPPPPEDVKEKPPEPPKRPESVEPKPKPPEPPKEEPNKDDAFSSLLKNLTPQEEEEAKKENQSPSLDEIIEDAVNLDQYANRLNFSEEDALRAQLSRCWNVLSGANMAENLVVRVLVQINADRSVANTSILDKSRYNRDPAFRAAADSAERALRNPNCSPLALPPEKFEQWKTLIIRFDPSEML